MAIKSRKYNKSNRMRRYKTMKGGSGAGSTGAGSAGASGSSRYSRIRNAFNRAKMKASRIFSRGPNIHKYAEDAQQARTGMTRIVNQKKNSLAAIAAKVIEFKRKKTHTQPEIDKYVQVMYVKPNTMLFINTRLLPNYRTLYLLSDLEAFAIIASNGSDRQLYPVEIVTPEMEKIKQIYDSKDNSTKEERELFISENYELFNNLVGGENYRLLQTNKKIISDEKRQSCINICVNHIKGIKSSLSSLDKHFKQFVQKSEEGSGIMTQFQHHLEEQLRVKNITIELSSLPPIDPFEPGFMARLAALRESIAGRKLKLKKGSRSKARKGRSHKKKRARAY